MQSRIDAPHTRHIGASGNTPLINSGIAPPGKNTCQLRDFGFYELLKLTRTYCDSWSGDQFRSGWTKVVVSSEMVFETPTHGDTKMLSDVLPAV